MDDLKLLDLLNQILGVLKSEHVSVKQASAEINQMTVSNACCSSKGYSCDGCVFHEGSSDCAIVWNTHHKNQTPLTAERLSQLYLRAMEYKVELEAKIYEEKEHDFSKGNRGAVCRKDGE